MKKTIITIAENGAVDITSDCMVSLNGSLVVSDKTHPLHQLARDAAALSDFASSLPDSQQKNSAAPAARGIRKPDLLDRDDWYIGRMVLVYGATVSSSLPGAVPLVRNAGRPFHGIVIDNDPMCMTVQVTGFDHAGQPFICDAMAAEMHEGSIGNPDGVRPRGTIFAVIPPARPLPFAP